MTVRSYWQSAYNCEPGCTCDNAHIEHDSIIQREHTVWTTGIEVDVRKRCVHWCQASIYASTCPGFNLEKYKYKWSSACNCDATGVPAPSVPVNPPAPTGVTTETTTNSSSSSSTTTYTVNGVEFTEEEYYKYLAS